MNFYQHTNNWIKGELFESKLIIAFGILTVIIGVLIWKMGNTPNSKALLLPLVITGGIYSAIGGNMLYSNQKRIVEMQQNFQENQTEFVQAEKKRVEDFQYQYKISKVVATVFFIATILIFWFTKNPTWQGIGIGLSLFGLAGLLVDYFSEERASIYYQKILEFLQL
ncbi:MAG: hypothetical protein CMC76_08770 [Flavobacteriaceae bacterium]|nr:hypothetical protein [Flavobacteriaceae bacterium]|tara:strand:+ start:1548 stop:2048 length:501 start_codon:yes stop_codon:yes gene_type:complete